MDYRFKADEWKDLTPGERARRCRFMAREAQALANAASPDLARAYKKIVDDWQKLADEIERAANIVTPSN
jgi:hypothetical protein